MKKYLNSEVIKYTLFGVVFGFLFPFVATLFVCIQNFGTIHWAGIVQVQKADPLLWIIDSAPFWLGLFALFGGIKQSEVITHKKVLEENLKTLDQLNENLELKIEERTKDLIKAKEDAENANKTKSNFISQMSHELRTPLNAILGFGQLMKFDAKQPLSSYHQDRLDSILKSGNHLLTLINELLDLAKIESGEMVMSIEPININDLTEEIFGMMNPIAKDQGIRLIDTSRNQKPTFINADEGRLRQVLLNLISNAIKYNRENGEVVLSYEEQLNGRLRIEIMDTGFGIPKEKHDRLFQPFDRLGVDEYKTEGTGIGLTITKNLVELMNGEIGFESTLGKGTCFFIELPISTETDSENSAASSIENNLESVANESKVL